jgi:tetratricopeptide (TPR) repeat protein
MKWYAVFFIGVFVLTSFVGSAGAQSQFEMGMKEFRDENYEEALTYFLEARKAEPTSSTVAFYTGLTYKIMEQYKEAIPYLRDAVTFTPRIKEALVELIDVLYQTDNIKEAKEWVDVGEKEGIQPGRIQFLKGLVYLKDKQYPEAIAGFEKAKELDPSLAQLAEFQIASANMQSGQYKEAQNRFKRAVSVDPTTDMATMARDYDKALAEKFERERPWRFSVGLGYKYDTNLVAKPAGGPVADAISNESDYAANMTARISYTFPFSFKTPYNLTIQYSINADRYMQRDDYNTMTNTLSFIPGYNFEKFSISVPITILYNWLQREKGTDFTQSASWYSDTKYMRYYSVMPTLRYMLTQNSIAEFSIGYTEKYYFIAPLTAPEERDGRLYNASIGYTYFFYDGRGFVNLKYTYAQDNTIGDNWANKEHRLGMSLLYPLWWKPLKLQVSSEAAFTQYIFPNATFDGMTRRNDTYNTSFGLVYELGKSTDITAQYTYIRDKSNISTYDYTREIFSLGIEYRY